MFLLVLSFLATFEGPAVSPAIDVTDGFTASFGFLAALGSLATSLVVDGHASLSFLIPLDDCVLLFFRLDRMLRFSFILDK